MSKGGAGRSGGTAGGSGSGSTGTASGRGGGGSSGRRSSSRRGYRSHGKYKKKGTEDYSKWGIYLPDWWRLKKKTRDKWDRRWKRSAKKRGGHESKYYLSEKRFKKWVKKKRKRIEKEISWRIPGYKSSRQDYEKLQKKFKALKEKDFGSLEKDYSTLRQQLGLGMGAAGGQQGWYNQAQEQQRMFEQQQAAMQRQYEQQALDYQKQIQAFNVANQQAQYSTMMAQRAPMAVAPNESGTNAYSDRWFRRDSPSTTAPTQNPVSIQPILPIQTPSISLV